MQLHIRQSRVPMRAPLRPNAAIQAYTDTRMTCFNDKREQGLPCSVAATREITRSCRRGHQGFSPFSRYPISEGSPWFQLHRIRQGRDSLMANNATGPCASRKGEVVWLFAGSLRASAVLATLLAGQGAPPGPCRPKLQGFSHHHLVIRVFHRQHHQGIPVRRKCSAEFLKISLEAG